MITHCPDCGCPRRGGGLHLGRFIGGTQFDCIGRVVRRFARPIEARPTAPAGLRRINTIQLPGSTPAATIWNAVIKGNDAKRG